MQKKPHTPLPEENKILQLLEENRYADWVGKNGRLAVALLAGFIIFLVIIFRFGLATTERGEGDFSRAQLLFVAAERAADAADIQQTYALLQQLSQLMEAHPSLHAKYDGAIAQRLLALEQGKEAEPYAQRTLMRTRSDQLVLFRSYAATTLLIGIGEHKQALEAANALAKELEQAELAGTAEPMLAACNQLRRAALEHKVGSAAGELAALHSYSQLSQRYGSEVTPLSSLAIGQVDLKQYIQERQRLLADVSSRAPLR